MAYNTDIHPIPKFETKEQFPPGFNLIVCQKILKNNLEKFFLKKLEIGVSTKLIVTARIRGTVLLKMYFLHI